MRQIHPHPAPRAHSHPASGAVARYRNQDDSSNRGNGPPRFVCAQTGQFPLFRALHNGHARRRRPSNPDLRHIGPGYSQTSAGNRPHPRRSQPDGCAAAPLSPGPARPYPASILARRKKANKALSQPAPSRRAQDRGRYPPRGSCLPECPPLAQRGCPVAIPRRFRRSTWRRGLGETADQCPARPQLYRQAGCHWETGTGDLTTWNSLTAPIPPKPNGWRQPYPAGPCAPKSGKAPATNQRAKRPALPAPHGSGFGTCGDVCSRARA